MVRLKALWVFFVLLCGLVAVLFFFLPAQLDSPYYRLGGIVLLWQMSCVPLITSLERWQDCIWGLAFLLFCGGLLLFSLQPREVKVILAMEMTLGLWMAFWTIGLYEIRRVGSPLFTLGVVIFYGNLYLPWGGGDWLFLSSGFSSPPLEQYFWLNPYPVLLYYWAQWDFFRLSWMYDLSQMSDYPYRYPSLERLVGQYSLAVVTLGVGVMLVKLWRWKKWSQKRTSAPM